MLFFLRCPAHFCEFRAQHISSYLHGVCRRTESKPFFFLSFFRISYGRFCIFPDVCIGHFSREKSCFSFVRWCMINTVSKIRIQIRSIERSVTNLPRWQHLGWPSSYVGVSPQYVGAKMLELKCAFCFFQASYNSQHTSDRS